MVLRDQHWNAAGEESLLNHLQRLGCLDCCSMRSEMLGPDNICKFDPSYPSPTFLHSPAYQPGFIRTYLPFYSSIFLKTAIQSIFWPQLSYETPRLLILLIHSHQAIVPGAFGLFYIGHLQQMLLTLSTAHSISCRKSSLLKKAYQTCMYF